MKNGISFIEKHHLRVRKNRTIRNRIAKRLKLRFESGGFTLQKLPFQEVKAALLHTKSYGFAGEYQF